MRDPLKESLYKYVNSDSLIKILEKCCFKISSRLMFNDLFECRADRILWHFMEAQAEQAMQSINKYIPFAYNELPVDEKQNIRKEIVEPVLSSSFIQNNKDYQAIVKRLNASAIFCLSEVSDSAPMWAHYGDSNKGAVIEINLPISRKLNSWLSAAESVRYADALNPAVPDFKTAMFTKESTWSYEKEWRVIFPGQFDNSAELSAFERFYPQEIKSIMLGVAATQEDIKRLRAILNFPRFNHVKLYKMEADRCLNKYIKKEI